MPRDVKGPIIWTSYAACSISDIAHRNLVMPKDLQNLPHANLLSVGRWARNSTPLILDHFFSNIRQPKPW
ncbi:hypothetical protein HZ326_2695 [Fusarium oxysporum f. sp. albedinis]|nr:hypothetical protein HZ326_2695 [Fusarium oxysporum f. sp. albedinis]